MKKVIVALLLVFMLLVSGCSQKNSGSDLVSNTGDPQIVTPIPDSNSSDTSSISGEVVTEPSELFSNRDFEVGYDENTSAIIRLEGNTATSGSDAVKIKGSTVTITDEGTYILSGTLKDGMIIVNADKKDKIQLVLNNASIHSETSAPIYILQADKVFITLAANSDNSLSNGGTFTAIDENNIDAVIFSKDDLTLNGSGVLSITSPAGHGIVSKDELTMTSGTYQINSASHGLAGKDNVCITNAEINITSDKDGIHAENNDDTTLGFIYIESGTFNISSEGDGIAASAQLQIAGGTFNIISGGGSANAEKKTSDFPGGFMGRGGPGGPGNGFMGGGRPGGPGDGFMGGNRPEDPEDGFIDSNPPDNTPNIDTGESGVSSKGLKAAGNLTVSGGSFIIDTADDAVHSNASMTISGGTFQIKTGDDGFHADDTLRITSGTINITNSYEGLEALHVDVSGGEITLYADDDGLNAAGGTDRSGFGGMRGNDRFGRHGSSSSNGSIVIAGGKLYINARGDGIDANGTLTISGGYTVVCGPTTGDTATLDYDVSGVITGGTFIGTGSNFMAQSFSDSEQGVIAIRAGNQPAGTAITLKDSRGNTIIPSYTPELDFAVVILSSPDIVKGETYTLTIGSTTGEFTAK